ncbi:MAG: GTPase [Candidatus Paceibacterota bacterium]
MKNKFWRWNNRSELETALKESRIAAKEGYQTASKRLATLSKQLDALTQPIVQLIEQSSKKNIESQKVVEDLTGQLREIVNNLNNIQNEVAETIHEKKETLNDFSITLFGRTKSGKSTLMEILTKGDGRTIGKGSQRTTRDVRYYDWKGLKITDVPGVAAFDGDDDEKLAYKAANLSDLIVFLITDDAPQAAEAQSFANVRSIGKPIIGICNVKIALKDQADLKLFLRRSKNLYNRDVIDLLEQFNDLVRDYTSSKFTPFTVTHLHSKFLSQNLHFNGGNYKKYHEQLEALSQFDRVEKRILQEVKNNGAFYRKKVFIDIISKPYLDFQNQLLEFSTQNSANARLYIDKQRKFLKWVSKFEGFGEKRIKTFVTKEMEPLRKYVPEFSEEHCEDRKAGKRWDEHVKSLDLEDHIKSFQTELQDECTQKMIDLVKELQNEVNFISANIDSKNISMDKITDTKKITRYTSTIIGAVGTLILMSNPAGWVLVAGWGLIALGGLLGIGTFFQPNKEEKRQKAKKNLSNHIYQNIDALESQVSKKLKKWFKENLIAYQIGQLDKDLKFLINATIKIADAQRILAWKLNKGIIKLNIALFDSALKLVDGESENNKVKRLARVPGNAWMLMIDTNVQFSEQVKKQLQDLLNESIWFVIDTNDNKSIVSQAIGRGVSIDDISIEEKLKIVHVNIENIELTTYMRLNLAQQLTDLHIMKH